MSGAARATDAPGPPRARRRRSRAGLMLLVIGLLAVAAELALRVIGVEGEIAAIQGDDMDIWRQADLLEPDPRPGLSYRNRPGAVAAFTDRGLTYEHDARGRRVTPGTPPPGAPTVVFLGDSVTYGLGVDADETLPFLVGAALDGAIRPVNLGVPGYGTSQEAALFEAEREHLGDVDLVVLVFFANDASPAVWRWHPGLQELYYDPLPVSPAVSNALWSSALYRGVTSAVLHLQKGEGRFDAANEANLAWALDEVSSLARRLGEAEVPLVVAYQPALLSLDPYDLEHQRVALRERCAELDVPFVDLLEPLLAERERETAAYLARSGRELSERNRRMYLQRFWVLPDEDPHPSARANALMAAPLADAVRELLER